MFSDIPQTKIDTIREGYIMWVFNERNDERLHFGARFKDDANYGEYPKDPEWLMDKIRRSVGKESDEADNEYYATNVRGGRKYMIGMFFFQAR